VRKNPAVALGVVLARLLQKDEEWCAAPPKSKSQALPAGSGHSALSP
jgi:hypothetical protein